MRADAEGRVFDFQRRERGLRCRSKGVGIPAGMEEADAPEPEAALRAERDALRAERDLLQQRLRDAHVKEQLLLTRVAELEAKYEPGVERSPNFRAAFAPSPFAGPEQRQPPVSISLRWAMAIGGPSLLGGVDP